MEKVWREDLFVDFLLAGEVYKNKLTTDIAKLQNVIEENGWSDYEMCNEINKVITSLLNLLPHTKYIFDFCDNFSTHVVSLIKYNSYIENSMDLFNSIEETDSVMKLDKYRDVSNRKLMENQRRFTRIKDVYITILQSKLNIFKMYLLYVDEHYSDILKRYRLKYEIDNIKEESYNIYDLICEHIDHIKNEFLNSEPQLNFDGVYRYCFGEGYELIRFFPDGIVVCVSCSEDCVPDWLNHDYEDAGKYEVTDNKIHFVISSENGDVEYNGTIVSEEIILLDSHSFINNHEEYDVVYSLRKY